jgi:hypothetical protein
LSSQSFEKSEVEKWTNHVEELFYNPPPVQDFYQRIGLGDFGKEWKDNPFWK